MRGLVVDIVLVAIAFACVACGPSNAEVKTAKLAHYTTSSQTLFDVALQATQHDYKVDFIDEEHRRFATARQFYNPDGGRESAGANGYIQYQDRSIALSLVVEILEADGGLVVAITPKAFQVLVGSPKPRDLAPDDPNLPSWVHGRVDSLAVAIYNAAKQYAAK